MAKACSFNTSFCQISSDDSGGFRAGHVGATAPFIEKTQLERPLLGEGCAPHHDFKALFYNCFDQNVGETCKSGRRLAKHQRIF